jgi:hypothetical protein
MNQAELEAELEEELLAILVASIDKAKVTRALEKFIETKDQEKLHPPEVIDYAAALMAAVVKTCPSREVAFKLFFKCLTESLPGVGVIVTKMPHVDQSSN